jgi:hypothetical protein
MLAGSSAATALAEIQHYLRGGPASLGGSGRTHQIVSLGKFA